MDKVVISFVVALAITAVLIADAAVVKTNTAIDKIVVNGLADGKESPVDVSEEGPKTATEAFDEDGDFLVFSELDKDIPQVPPQTIEDAPFDARDLLIWKAYDSESSENPILLRKETQEVDNTILKEYYTVLSSLQNPLQIDNQVSGLQDWSKVLLESQGALSQEHEQGTTGGTGLMCYESHGLTEVKKVTCAGSCVWLSSSGFVKQSCSTTFHKDETIYSYSRIIRFCNTNLCN